MTHPSPASDARLSALYQEVILDHYRRPRNKRALEAPTGVCFLKNPVCGDEVDVQLIVRDGVVAEATFGGRGCSISQASASMMTELVKGRTLEDVRALVDRFAAMLRGDAEAAKDEKLGQARALAGVARFPARIRCASIAWDALLKAMK
jgi:nitrogen fixation NifU-like protein